MQNHHFLFFNGLALSLSGRQSGDLRSGQIDSLHDNMMLLAIHVRIASGCKIASIGHTGLE